MLEISNGAKKAIELLRKNGHEAYLVGGCVRDMIMGIMPHDYDITTSATPDEMKEAFEGFQIVETGIKHGTITFIYEKEPIEITTYRIEGEYRDNRHPESVEFTKKLDFDLSRRDFTMNAIVYNDEEGVKDLFGGQNDIENKIIRAIGDPEKRFQEDALRILRAARFSSTLGFKIEENTKAAMVKCAPLLHNISAERINAELTKLLVGKYVKNTILDCYEIIGEIIPEIKKMHGFDQHNKYHIYNVLEHTAVSVESIDPVPHLRLAMLLHDTGKIKCFTREENGTGHFYGHPSASARIAEEFLKKYKYDNFTKERVCELVRIHDSPIEMDRIFIRKRMSRIGKDMFFDLIKVKRADNMAQNPEFCWLDKLKKMEDIAKDIAENDCFTLSRLNVSGNDLIALGYKGQEIGNTLNFLLKEVINEKIPNEREKLLERVRKNK